jgi:hypothetical protein
MKKAVYLSILFLSSLGIPALAQTLGQEYKSMMDRYLAKEMSQLEFRDLTFAWRALIDSAGYPDIPYDSLNNKVEYVFTNSLEGISRQTIVNRVSEWAAISFGSTNRLLTEQGSSSRLIINGYMEIFFPDLFMVYKNAWRGYVETEMQNSSICYFTMVFTIREGRMKSQILNISYEYTDFISDRSIRQNLISFFPISSSEKDEWKAIIGLMHETRRSLHAMMDTLMQYIQSYEQDYSW